MQVAPVDSNSYVYLCGFAFGDSLFILIGIVTAFGKKPWLCDYVD